MKKLTRYCVAYEKQCPYTLMVDYFNRIEFRDGELLHVEDVAGLIGTNPIPTPKLVVLEYQVTLKELREYADDVCLERTREKAISEFVKHFSNECDICIEEATDAQTVKNLKEIKEKHIDALLTTITK